MPYSKVINLNTEIKRSDQINLLAPNAFNFSIDKVRYSDVGFLVQKALVPSLAISFATFSGPHRNAPMHADKVTYDPLVVSFLVDENLRNYLEIHDWLLAQVIQVDYFPEDYKRRDIKMTILSSHNNPVYTITYVDAFPTDISSLNFDSTITDVDYTTVEASFQYSYYKIESVSGANNNG